jgi:hypothetical protein
MAPLAADDNEQVAAFNAVVEQQNGAFAAGDFDKALVLNAKMTELAKPILVEQPATKGMIAYDRAVILLRKGDAVAGLSLLDESYALGDLRAVGDANLPVDLYDPGLVKIALNGSFC